MASESPTNTSTGLIARKTISRLSEPIKDVNELLSILCTPLGDIGLLPPALRGYCNEGLKNSWSIHHISSIQCVLLEHVIPTWEASLKEQKLISVFYLYFCPDAFFSSMEMAASVALAAYGNLLSFPLREFTIQALCKINLLYPIDRMFSAIFSRSSSMPLHQRINTWEDLVRHIVSIPAKVANYMGTRIVPEELTAMAFYARLCSRFEVIIASAPFPSESEPTPSLSFLLSKMVNIGLFPSALSLASFQPSFFLTCLPTIRMRFATLSMSETSAYEELWIDLFSSLSTSSLIRVLSSLSAHTTDINDDLDASAEARGLVKREARIFVHLFGPLGDEDDEKWQAITSVWLGREWSIAKCRMLVCWASLSDENVIRPKAIETLLSKTLAIWASSERIKHSLLSEHQYLTTLLLLVFFCLPTASHSVQALGVSPDFISAISAYISHLDPAVRRCGMLAAELVANRIGKVLDFEQWDGESQDRDWARKVRKLILERDVDVKEADANVIRLEYNTAEAIGKQNGTDSAVLPTSKKAPIARKIESEYDSDDDSVAGYASSPASSRSPSPTHSELEEIEKDPTVRLGRKKVQKPVYLADLGNMLKTSAKPDDADAAERLDVALRCAEELIRRKSGFGLELEENTVNLVYALLCLNNNYNLNDFSEMRQSAVNALVACCPQKAAPAIIDEFFKNQYSTDQRFVMLNALALGARELAGLPIPPSRLPADRTSFPSKQLPSNLHAKYLTDGDVENLAGSQVRRMLEHISSNAIDSGRDVAEEKIPLLVRDRQLRLKQPKRVVETGFTGKVAAKPSQSTFADLAAESFLGPLVGKFWIFLREEQAREERSKYRSQGYRYKGTGTGLILSSLVLSQFLGTTAVMAHAARHSPAFLAVLSPDLLELAITLGTNPMFHESEAASTTTNLAEEAALLTTSLELALVIMDACLEIDQGRSLALEHTTLLLGVGEWAGHVLSALESGARAPGGGGMQEVRLRRSAAGLILKVEELTSRWSRSMLSI